MSTLIPAATAATDAPEREMARDQAQLLRPSHTTTAPRPSGSRTRARVRENRSGALRAGATRRESRRSKPPRAASHWARKLSNTRPLKRRKRRAPPRRAPRDPPAGAAARGLRGRAGRSPPDRRRRPARCNRGHRARSGGPPRRTTETRDRVDERRRFEVVQRAEITRRGHDVVIVDDAQLDAARTRVHDENAHCGQSRQPGQAQSRISGTSSP